MRKRTLYTLAAALLILCALAAAVYLRQKAPPEVARLLPESDAIVYVNLKPIRTATHFDQNPVQRSPSYQHFIEQTGIIAERDLDRAAFALHRMTDPRGPNGPIAFSEVLEGRFDRQRLTAYLASLANAQETYAGRTIYDIPSEGRTLRIVILGYDTVAASNMPTPEQIHSILDRFRASASPFSGSALLEARYKDVPAFASAWAIGHIGLPFSQSGKINILGLELPLPADTTFVASLRLAAPIPLTPPAVILKIDELTPTELAAAQSTQSLNGLLNLFRAIQLSQQPIPRTPEEAATRQLIDSIQIIQHKDRATLTAQIPTETLKHLTP